QMGDNVAYSSAIPENALSDVILAILNNLSVQTQKALRTGDRLGTYMLMSANGLSTGEVIYDRKYSSFSQLTIEDVDIDILFERVSWLHWAALTAARNQNIPDLVARLLQVGCIRTSSTSLD